MSQKHEMSDDFKGKYLKKSILMINQSKRKQNLSSADLKVD